MHAQQIINTVTVFGLVLLVLVSTSAVADKGDDKSPDGLVQTITDEVLNTLRNDRETIRKDPQQLISLMERIIVPHVDIRFMGREVLGRYWKRASEAQRARFLAAFRRMLIDDYAAVFRHYSNESVELLPMHADARKDNTLVSVIVNKLDGERIRVDYRLHRDGAGWRIYDVEVDGISLLLNFRNTFSDQLQGGTLDALITSIENKNTSFHLKTGK
jgi:phospholipid transport system substrate-binding protein